MPELAVWGSFYSIVGESAGALIGLQFVVMTLIAQSPPLRAVEGAATYATPSVVLFSVVLLLSALMLAPWHSVEAIALICGAIGVLGLAYTVIIARRMLRLNGYRPEFEDWLFHLVVPLSAYAILAASSWVAVTHPRGAGFGIAGAVLLLLFTGIHNTWDALTYHVLVHMPKKRAMRGDDS